MLVIVLHALVVRAAPSETAAEARDRLWRSVERHDHEGLVCGTAVRCVVCGAILMGLVS